MQGVGPGFKASGSSFKSSSNKVVFSTDIAGAYPDSAGVEIWVRTYTLQRGKQFTINDSYSLKSISGESSIVFMTPLKSEVNNGFVRVYGDGFNLKITYPSSVSRCDVEEIVLEDSRLSGVWGKKLYRIVFPLKAEKRNELVLKVEKE